MPKATWLEQFRQTLAKHSRRKNQRAEQLPAEQLEARSYLSATTLVANNSLAVYANANESIDVRINPGNTTLVQVLINGNPDPSLPTLQASQVREIQIFAGQGNNQINLGNVSVTSFSYLDAATGDRLRIVVDAGNGHDSIVGSPDLPNSIIGGHGDDTILGGNANDTLVAGDGADQVTGGLGNDSILAGNGNDTVQGGDGSDTLEGSDGIDSLNGDAGSDSIVGGDGDDLLNGGADSDTIDGQNGADSVLGGDGADSVFGSVGNDTLDGEAGNDTIFGQIGNDFVVGGADDDSLLGQVGNDTIQGSAGNDILIGDLGVDLLDGEGDNDSIYGGSGNDSLIGGSGNDLLRGQIGNDLLSDVDGADTLQGDSGNDSVTTAGIDIPVLVGIANAAVLEGDVGTTNAVFVVSLSSPPRSPVTVTYSTGSASATPGVDFTPVSGVLNFGVGTTSLSVAVPVLADTLDEPNELLTLRLNSATGATIEDASAVATITDDDAPSSIVSSAVAQQNALSYLKSNASTFGLTQLDVSNYVITDQYTDDHNGVTHVYMTQTYLGIPVVDAKINVNVAADGSIINAHSRFIGDIASSNLSATPTLTSDQALGRLRTELADELIAEARAHSSNIAGLEDYLDNILNRFDSTDSGDLEIDIALSPIAPRLQWTTNDNGGLELGWTLNVVTPTGDGWWDATVSATTGELLHNSSWIDHASYNVFNYNLEGPIDGGRTIEVDPHDPIASPFGWHDDNGLPGAEYTDTRGNNVYAQGGRSDILLLFGFPFGTDPRPDGGPALDFDFPFNDTTQQPVTTLDAATTNLFYMVNINHDIHYQYGFNEASGNFQFNNYGQGGVGNDQVGANAQALASFGFFNNAFMATPPDGFSPSIAMFEWSLTNPRRDGDYENTIITHEFGHGVSNRLTGGPADANALNDLQSGGMGEGWSDWWSLMFSQQPGDLAGDRRTVGNYVLGQGPGGSGIRRFPYSFDMAINSQTLGDFNGGFPNNEVHNAGELWTTVLWDMNWLLINGLPTEDCDGNVTPAYGFDPDLYNGTGGNNIALQLVMDGLKLQPANPTFIEARDAILQADMITYGGANQRAIWTAFARRGYGFSASAGPNANSQVVVEAFDMPPELGAVRFDQLTYSPGDVVTIEVCDADQAGSASVTVNVTMTGGDTETVVLNAVIGGSFVGTIPLQRATVAANNGFLDIAAEASILTASYVDLNDGSGGTVSLQALAVVSSPIGDTLVGNDGDDVISAGDGPDLITGDLGADLIAGNGGNDSIYGGAGNDTISGGDGDDLVLGNAGADSVEGNNGDDQVVWRGAIDGNDTLTSSDGRDGLEVRGSGASDSFSIGQSGSTLQVTAGPSTLSIPVLDDLSAGLEVVTVNLGRGDDTVTVGDLTLVGAVVLNINGDDGDDTVNAFGSNTGSVLLLANGGLGNDTLTGGGGADSLSGDDGDDLLSGQGGHDTLLGGNGRDALLGNDGNDSLLGEAGADVLSGNAGQDSLNGGLDNDNLNGGLGDDLLAGDFGDDQLNGDFGNDSLLGEAGADSLIGAAGNDTLDGGRNNDVIGGNSGNDVIRGDHGDDQINSGAGDDTIDAGDGNDTVDAGDGNDAIAAGDGNDFINGNTGDDLIVGGDGNDTLIGAAGSDILVGNDGNDAISGGGSADTVVGGQGSNVIVVDVSDVRDENFVLSFELLARLNANV